MRNIEHIEQLVSGEIDPKKKDEVITDIENGKDQKEIFSKLKIAWALLSSTKNMPQYKIEKSYADIQQTLFGVKKTKVAWVHPFLKYAAILFVVLGMASVLFYFRDQSKSISKYTTVLAENGQMSKVVLPDNSVVLLNSGSRLTYNNNFAVNNRDLKLNGQAYFDVTKDKESPLTVSCGDVIVKVLGTKFEVRGYDSEERLNVILESGSVQLLHSKKGSFDYVLEPGERADYDVITQGLTIRKMLSEEDSGWRNGMLIFNDAPMKEVIHCLQRKFDVKIFVENTEVYKSIFNAKFKSESLNEILDYIEYTCPIRYEILEKSNSSKQEVRLTLKN